MTSPHHTPSPELAAIIAETRAELLADRERRAGRAERSELTLHAERMRRARVAAKADRLAKENAAEAVELACRASAAAIEREDEKRRAAAPASCGICRGKCGCKNEIPASSDPRWERWILMPRSRFGEMKQINLDAYESNKRADAVRPVGCVASYGGWWNR